ncbi:hypothetical protein CEP88_09455 [Roseobacter denitrificans]|uniref:Uncharacterized protein n=1 Tax=Roseobacter denitrificans (strain ATCC 33942 / OCh 114) TaxID=375451 RepID=Q160V4_ROSDO|nr:hypothetical protein RD1_4044 [Roseobacter denitrificans OCh 114]AVL52805.1 hypothetical protein CEP88_09455 [Roseobacter denitrificans]SFG05264.1 hypothetical protein SAMN05443635_106183 [Roseobacter denitrificans OCh 114]
MAKLPSDRTELAEKTVAGALHPLSAYRIGRGKSVSALARTAALSPDTIRSIELSEMPETSDAIKAVTAVVAAEIASDTNGSSGTGFVAGDGFSNGGGVDAGGGAM